MSGGTELLHASAVAIDGRAVLIGGASGRGKSDLALRLIDRGAVLIADDYVDLVRQGRVLLASPPETIAGRIEVRGIGIACMAFSRDVPVALYVDLDSPPERLPEARSMEICGHSIRSISINGLESSAPLKIELALSGNLLPLE